jgi:tRNA-2-methylthio-N6-dimethylallyladenosine synthase
LLTAQGYAVADREEDADVILLNTCSVRAHAEERAFGKMGLLQKLKRERPDLVLGILGCMAKAQREEVFRRLPQVDLVAGPAEIYDLPDLLAGVAERRQRAGLGARVRVLAVDRKVRPLDRRPATDFRAGRVAAWVTIMEGCDKKCAYCIVPTTRGQEVSRPLEEILDEVQQLARAGYRQVTLLGQNVNSYGRSFGDRLAFGKLLRACGEIDGLERVRFTSPHPRDFTDDVIAAMAETPNVMPQLHMPMQSGSDAVLRAMRRSYRRERYLGIIDRVRSAMPDAAITTDIIVGFPGETDADFEQTLDAVRAARFASAFTFQYSKRPGTPAATMDDQVPQQVVTERYDRLIELQESISLAGAQSLVGAEVEVLVSRGEGRKDGATGRVSARARDGRLVHVAAGPDVAPGDVVTSTVTHAAPHHLVADAGVTAHRRWRGAATAGEHGAPTRQPQLLTITPRGGS